MSAILNDKQKKKPAKFLIIFRSSLKLLRNFFSEFLMVFVGTFIKKAKEK